MFYVWSNSGFRIGRRVRPTGLNLSFLHLKEPPSAWSLDFDTCLTVATWLCLHFDVSQGGVGKSQP
ncbi:MAG: hypothetical protein NDI91_03015 [Sulfuritalea sp.]|nr:hypothetical protein [Sulfuritalea sp.]